MKLPILQGPLRGYWWTVGSGIHSYWLGSYEADKLKNFCEVVRKGQVVLDIGAHAGFYTLLASELVGPKGQVIAFEPFPKNIYFLKKHLEINRIQNVLVWEAAVGSMTGLSRFKVGSDGYTGSLSSSGEVCVSVVNLDDLVSDRLIPVPDVIKMDIEGGELEALTGAVDLLSYFHPVLFLSTHGAAIHNKCLELLTSVGYQITPLISDAQRPDEIVASWRPGIGV